MSPKRRRRKKGKGLHGKIWMGKGLRGFNLAGKKGKSLQKAFIPKVNG